MRDMAHRVLDILWRRVEVGRGRYLALAAALSLAVSGVAVFVYWLVFTALLGLGAPPDTAEEIPHLAEMLVGWVIVAPILETAIMAMFVGIARSLTQEERLQILAGAVPLGLAHAFQGVSVWDAGGHAFVSVISFLVYALVYVVWRRVSFRDAFWMGAGVHMIHNFVLVLFVLGEQALTGSR